MNKIIVAVTSTKESGWMVRPMALEIIATLMGLHIKDSGLQIGSMETV